MNYNRWFVPQFSLALDHVVHFWWDRWRRGYEFAIYESWWMRAAKRLREMMHEIRNKGAPHGWIRDDLWDRLVEFWRQEDYKKLKQTNKKNRASETGGSLHIGGSTTYEATRERMVRVGAGATTDTELGLCEDPHPEGGSAAAFQEELKGLQTERQAIIDSGGPEPPPINEDAVWTRIAGARKRGRIYGKGVVPSHKYPALFGDPDDDDTATGPPDLREQVVLLNREFTQQAETHSQKVAALEAVYSEKVRRLESTMQAQSQEVSDLRKAYSDMYSYLSHIWSGSSSSGMPDMPPSPPPPPPAQSRDPHHSQTSPPNPHSLRMTLIIFETFSLSFTYVFMTIMLLFSCIYGNIFILALLEYDFTYRIL
ncbi:hypothetical protein PIB30_093916 [Stylosanthes scabra]|uniref:Transposase, Ptta/En/Spm, plant n=1 Tax=Stylosanthes scabra TaxID=79078 RepID=A0ABU6YUJ2_9FABA|nr:hypothetical protein [Stylosanthes scabra]